MARTESVTEVHDLHLWEIAPGVPILTAHVLVPQGIDCHAVRRTLEDLLKRRFHIEHTTLQVEHASKTISTITRAACGPGLAAEGSTPLRNEGDSWGLAESAADERQHLITFALHLLRGCRLKIQANQRLRVGRAYIEMPIGIFDRDTIHGVGLRI